MDSTRINIFQRLVRQWDKIHPYNAAQVLRIAGSPDYERLQITWQQSIAALGLGKLRVSGSSFRYENLNGQLSSYALRRPEPSVTLEDFISFELNEPFDESEGLPFRPFIIQDGDAYYAGVVYQHWIADSVSIRLLLREWFVRMFDPSQARKSPVQIPRGGYWRFFSPNRANWRFGEGFLSSVRWSSRFKRVRRIENPAFGDFRVKFSLHRTPAGWIDRLRTMSRGTGMTLNDVFLAAIAEACDMHVPVIPTPKRQDLALGSIVDLRPHSREDLSDTFGLFLGFTSVFFRPAELKDWPRLLRTVTTQTTMHKATGVPQASPVRMLAGLVAGRMLIPENVVRFYRKRVPLAGGISNVNLNHSWAADYHPEPLLEYIRVSPTGPMMPLVFTTTTLGQQFHFGLTRRASVIPDNIATSVADHFVKRLSDLNHIDPV